MLRRRLSSPAPVRPYSHQHQQSSTSSTDLDLIQSRSGSTIKERKAARRKEKSRVAAQIRRNKESQTLILLQNALPVALPSPNQMLEKSIVIRIAGQTLFLLNSLDQVLGTVNSVTVPLLAHSFLGFFTDAMGQIVYVSPNIQAKLDQYHWSNLIGLPLHEVLDISSGRWPSPGEIVRLRLPSSFPAASSSSPSSHSSVTDSALKIQRSHSFSSSSSSSHSSSHKSPTAAAASSSSFFQHQPAQNNPRSLLVSKLESRHDSPGGANHHFFNQFSSNSSLYSVWCATSITHTNCSMRLLLLRAVSSPASSHQPQQQQQTQQQQQRNADNWSDPQRYARSNPGRPITSVHDSSYSFQAVSSEFAQLLELEPTYLKSANFLSYVHLEDLISVKTALDSVFNQHQSQTSTPVYRIIKHSGESCYVQTLAKLCPSTSHQSVIFNHTIIKQQVYSDVARRVSSPPAVYFHSSSSYHPTSSVTSSVTSPDPNPGLEISPIITLKKSSSHRFLPIRSISHTPCSIYPETSLTKTPTTILLKRKVSNQKPTTPSSVFCPSSVTNNSDMNFYKSRRIENSQWSSNNSISSQFVFTAKNQMKSMHKCEPQRSITKFTNMEGKSESLKSLGNNILLKSNYDPLLTLNSVVACQSKNVEFDDTLYKMTEKSSYGKHEPDRRSYSMSSTSSPLCVVDMDMLGLSLHDADFEQQSLESYTLKTPSNHVSDDDEGDQVSWGWDDQVCDESFYPGSNFETLTL